MLAFNYTASLDNCISRIFIPTYFNELYSVKVVSKAEKSINLLIKDYTTNKRKFKHSVSLDFLITSEEVYFSKKNITSLFVRLIRGQRKLYNQCIRIIYFQKNNFRFNKFRQLLIIFIPALEVPP